jgi:hypothetical protein
MTGKVSLRGLIWVLVGLALLFANYAGLPLSVRGTRFPFWIVIVALGVVLLVWDAVKARRRKEDSDPPPP